MEITKKNLLPNNPVNREDIIAAEDIYGPNLAALKGKTAHRPNTHVETTNDGVPPQIMSIYRRVTLAVDIMYVNKVMFMMTVSRGLKFGTVERILNRKMKTIKACISEVIALYRRRGFRISTILADPEFQPLQSSFPGAQLDCCGADEHVPEIERYIRTVKDRARSCYNMLPFQYVPRLVLVHLIKNSVFWLNSFPAADGASSTESPRYILTGRKIRFDRHVRLEFGAYVQTHEQHTNDMRT